MDKTTLGDRMKRYESTETQRKLMPLLPIYARLDGKRFSRFTKGFKRPFDESFRSVMDKLTHFLVREFGAVAGYTQSDEISLAWKNDSTKQELLFGGKIQKINSLIAAKATAKFFELGLAAWGSEKMSSLPCFDCRVLNMPNQEEVANMFLWRERDATKNSISMLASSLYSEKELRYKNQSERQELIFQKGINWNNLPTRLKRGTWVIKREVLMGDESAWPLNLYTRNKALFVELPPFDKVENKAAVIFSGAEEVRYEE